MNLESDSEPVPCRARLSVPVPVLPMTLPTIDEPVPRTTLWSSFPSKSMARPPLVLSIVPVLVTVVAPFDQMVASLPLVEVERRMPELTTVPPPSSSIADPTSWEILSALDASMSPALFTVTSPALWPHTPVRAPRMRPLAPLVTVPGSIEIAVA